MIEDGIRYSLNDGQIEVAVSGPVVQFFQEGVVAVEDWEWNGTYCGDISLSHTQMDRLVSLWQQWKSQTQETQA